jgi:hypothetical protein
VDLTESVDAFERAFVHSQATLKRAMTRIENDYVNKKHVLKKNYDI